MRRTSSVIIILFIFQHCLAEKTDDSDFYAYYTKVNYGEPWERHSLTSKYADLIGSSKFETIHFQDWLIKLFTLSINLLISLLGVNNRNKQIMWIN